MNDSRLTAYALGELESAERENLEKDLAASAALQAELQEIIALAEQLPASIASTDGLADTQRTALRARFAEEQRTRIAQRALRRRLTVASLGALAAGVAATAIVIHNESAPAPQNTPLAQASVPPQPQKIEHLLAEAKGFFDRGSYDLATKRYEQTLALDDPNIAAREGLEQVDRARSTSAAEAHNSTRSTLIAEASQGWKQSSRHIPGGAAVVANAEPLAKESVASAPKPASTPALVAAKDSKLEMAIAGIAPASAPFEDTEVRLDRARQTSAVADESYAETADNSFLDATSHPLSTFSIDVDTASYANVRRFLAGGSLPPAEAVRLEELVNYFRYADPQPAGGAPFSVNTEVTKAPWNSAHLLARIALKGRDIAPDALPPSNLVFLVDVSGSMDEPNKLPLLQRSLLALVEKLSPQDRVAIVTYAGASGLVLDSTPGTDKARIRRAIEDLNPGGSTNGASGIQLAYETARAHFLKDGNNRIVLCTDGDFNVGVTSLDALTKLIERERKSGVFLSVLGFGTGNLKDATMENLADKGDGNYAYIDTPAEGRRVLVDQMRGTLFTIAKDVKIQVEFNPATVAGYRLIGYENRLLAKEDFNNDKKDAGEIGADHSVTALYEIVPAGQPLPNRVDPLKYQRPEPSRDKTPASASTDLFTVKLRYKLPDGDRSTLIEKTVGPQAVALDKASENLRFAAAVAAFGMKLRGGADDTALSWTAVQSLARSALGEDADASRAEFLTLVQKAKQIAPDRGE